MDVVQIELHPQWGGGGEPGFHSVAHTICAMYRVEEHARSSQRKYEIDSYHPINNLSYTTVPTPPYSFLLAPPATTPKPVIVVVPATSIPLPGVVAPIPQTPSLLEDVGRLVHICAPLLLPIPSQVDQQAAINLSAVLGGHVLPLLIQARPPQVGLEPVLRQSDQLPIKFDLVLYQIHLEDERGGRRLCLSRWAHPIPLPTQSRLPPSLILDPHRHQLSGPH